MAIQLECINFIVPIAIIEQKYPGGWAQCLADHEHDIGHRVWYDEHLFRDGGMNAMDIMGLLSKWEKLGFKVHDGGENPSRWIDVCVVEAFDNAPTLPCDWIAIEDGMAFMKS